jgi:DNA-binding NarL/FixJ family response regulator
LTRILIADDHLIVRKGVRDLVDAHMGWEICGEAADAQEALQIAAREKPDIAVLDIVLRGLDGIELTRRLHQEHPALGILLFSMCDDEQRIQDGLAAGARGFVLKTDRQAVLEAAISALSAKLSFLSPSVQNLMSKAATNRPERSRLESFTVRELEVARLVADGHSNRKIAGILGISVYTVASHRSAAMRKADTSTAAKFIRFIIKHNLVEA